MLVYDRCVYLDLTVKGTWQEMRDYCQSLDSDLAVLSSVNFFFQSLQYMKATGECMLGGRVCVRGMCEGLQDDGKC